MSASDESPPTASSEEARGREKAGVRFPSALLRLVVAIAGGLSIGTLMQLVVMPVLAVRQEGDIAMDFVEVLHVFATAIGIPLCWRWLRWE